MKVFMSWSGLRSKLTAELLHDWIKCVIQAAQPWISSKGIERGALWFSEINNELKDTAVGVICLTQENKNAPWILFEAGALAKGLSTNRVCTFLVDLNSAELQPPLAQFNHTFPNKESMWSLVTTLNNGLELTRLDVQILRRVFETYWPQFEADFNEILLNNPTTTVVEPREEKDILAEILETTRSMSHRVSTLENRNSLLATNNSLYQATVRKGFRQGTAENEKRFNGAVEIALFDLERGITTEHLVPKLMKLFGLSETRSIEAVDLAQLIAANPLKSVD